jgi:Flp pilus assembly protein TadG
VPLRCPIGRRYLADQEGGLLVLFALSLAIIFGFMALVFDIGRTVGTASELQSYADHIALVAAGELDREPGAIAAAEALVASGDFDDFQTFASDDPGLGADDVTLTFYRSIPDDDGAPLTDVTTDDAEASFVQVVIRPHTVTNLFAGVVNALTGSDIGASVVSAAAVAGRDRQACGITPLVMCAPTGGSYDPVPGRMIHLRSGIRWEPGEFGVLADNFEPGSDCGNFGTAGSAVVECVLGIMPSVGRCYAASGLTIVNGLDDDEIAAGLNVRFDIYREALRNDEDDPRFAPAPNVAKGFGPESGNCIDDYDVTDFTSFPTPFFERSIPLPRDACFNLAGICNLTGSNIGTGISNLLLDIYWFLNHGTARPPAGSRFELYQQEILNPPAADRLLEEPRQETGLATCYANGAVPTPAGPERRLVTAAVINCDGDQGLPNQGLVQNVPALKFVQLFMTEPADSRIGGNVVSAWFEEVGEVVPGTPGLDGASVHDVVQLYR